MRAPPGRRWCGRLQAGLGIIGFTFKESVTFQT
jgi:hypothetical protein